jgi:hypothetical protein
MSESRARASGAIILKLIWGGMLMTQLVFIFLFNQIVNRRPAVGIATDFALLQWIGIAAGAISIVIFRKRLSGGAMRELLARENFESTVGHVIPWCMGVWALNSVITMMGFVQGFLSASFQVFLPALVLGLVLQIAMYPRLEGEMRKMPNPTPGS